MTYDLEDHLTGILNVLLHRRAAGLKNVLLILNDANCLRC